MPNDSLSSLAQNEDRLALLAEHAEVLQELAQQKDDILAVVSGSRPLFVPEYRAFVIPAGG